MLKKHFYIFIVCILVALLYFIYGNDNYEIQIGKKKFTMLEFILTDFPKKRIYNKNEKECRRIIEGIYGAPFPSIRPDFLKSPRTGKNLELDMYNKDLKLAFEYNGVQHYKYTPFFHKSYKDFEKQKLNDGYKALVCKNLGIKLINIPYTTSYKDLNMYLTNICNKLKNKY
jgi:hypothetical protein